MKASLDQHFKSSSRLEKAIQLDSYQVAVGLIFCLFTFFFSPFMIRTSFGHDDSINNVNDLVQKTLKEGLKGLDIRHAGLHFLSPLFEPHLSEFSNSNFSTNNLSNCSNSGNSEDSQKKNFPLEILYADYNQFTRIEDEWFSRLFAWTELYLSNNCILSISGTFDHLVILSLDHNFLSEFPCCFLNCSKLESLSVSNNQLKSWLDFSNPSWSMKLTHLNLQNNPTLTPTCALNLQGVLTSNIVSLNLSKTGLTHFPVELALFPESTCPNLCNLNISGNYIQSIPTLLWIKREKLKNVLLHGNPCIKAHSKGNTFVFVECPTKPYRFQVPSLKYLCWDILLQGDFTEELSDRKLMLPLQGKMVSCFICGKRMPLELLDPPSDTSSMPFYFIHMAYMKDDARNLYLRTHLYNCHDCGALYHNQELKDLGDFLKERMDFVNLWIKMSLTCGRIY